MQDLKNIAVAVLLTLKVGERVDLLYPELMNKQGLREEKLKIEVFLCMSMLSLFQSDIDFVCLVRQYLPHTLSLGTMYIYLLSCVKKQQQKLPSDRIMER